MPMRWSGSAACSIAAVRSTIGICSTASPARPENFQFNIGQLEGDFSSPRHRHNFDQFRFQLEGTMNFDRDGKVGAGSFGYFPEGADYGPQSSEGRAVAAVLRALSRSCRGRPVTLRVAASRRHAALLRLVLPDLTGIKERPAAHAVAAE